MRERTRVGCESIESIQAWMGDRGKGLSLTAVNLKRLWIRSYEALRTQVTLLRKVPSLGSDVRVPASDATAILDLGWQGGKKSCRDEPTILVRKT